MDSWPPVPPYVRLFAADSKYAPPQPPPVIDGAYEMFGMPYNTHPVPATLQASGIQQLTDGVSAVDDLRKLTRSVLLCYTELVQGVVLGEVGATETRLAALETMFLNMHFIVNSHRPQQAVETAEALVRLEIERQLKLAKDIHAACDDAEALLKRRDADNDQEPAMKKQK